MRTSSKRTSRTQYPSSNTLSGRQLFQPERDLPKTTVNDENKRPERARGGGQRALCGHETPAFAGICHFPIPPDPVRAPPVWKPHLLVQVSRPPLRSLVVVVSCCMCGRVDRVATSPACVPLVAAQTQWRSGALQTNAHMPTNSSDLSSVAARSPAFLPFLANEDL